MHMPVKLELVDLSKDVGDLAKFATRSLILDSRTEITPVSEEGILEEDTQPAGNFIDFRTSALAGRHNPFVTVHVPRGGYFVNEYFRNKYFRWNDFMRAFGELNDPGLYTLHHNDDTHIYAPLGDTTAQQIAHTLNLKAAAHDVIGISFKESNSKDGSFQGLALQRSDVHKEVICILAEADTPLKMENARTYGQSSPEPLINVATSTTSTAGSPPPQHPPEI
eukprot:8053_1